MDEGSREHLLVVTTNFLQNTGGVQGHLRALLPRLVDRGIDCTVAYLGSPEPPQTWQGVRVLTLKRHLDVASVLGVPRPDEWLRLARLVREDRLLGTTPVTCIATHTRFFPMSWLGVRLGRDLGIPVLHTEHGGGHVVTSSGVLQQGSRIVDLTMGRAVLRGANRIVAVSRRSAGFVERLAGVPAEVLNNGVDLTAWEQSAPAAAAVDRPLVFIGRVVEEKGWRDFLEVVTRCRAAGWGGVAHVFGDGPDREAAEALARTAGLGDVVFHGHATPPQMAAVLAGGVYVNPSLASEGFQLTLVEAIAAGASVASYAVGGTDELLDLPWADLQVVPQGDVDALATGAIELVRHPAPSVVHEDVAMWEWDRVADQYARMVRATARCR